MTSAERPVIETRQLTKVYRGKVRAVDDLNLAVNRGEIFGLLGPNGAGKTTTTGMLTTRIKPTSGQACIDGIDVWKQPALAKLRIGVVSQFNTLDRALTVRENLWFHGRYFGMNRGETNRETERLLAAFGLEGRGDDPVVALSGGLAQRVMLARAVLHRPQVLFLDEPTTGLDPQSRLALWNILKELNAAGQTILLSTHYMDEAERLCDRIAIIEHGAVIAMGTPPALKRSAGIDTQVAIAAEGSIAGLTEVLRRALPSARQFKEVDGKVWVSVTETDGVLSKLVLAAEVAGFRVRDVAIVPPSLETVFLHLTGETWR